MPVSFLPSPGMSFPAASRTVMARGRLDADMARGRLDADMAQRITQRALLLAAASDDDIRGLVALHGEVIEPAPSVYDVLSTLPRGFA